MALQARLAAASDRELIAELESGYGRFAVAEEMSRRKAKAFVDFWRPLLAGEHRLDRCLAGLVLARAGEDEGLAVVLAELAASTAQLRGVRALRDRGAISHEEYWSRTYDARHIQSLAVQVLGLIGDPRAVDTLIEATHEHSASQAILSLGEIGDRRAIPVLREMARLQPAKRYWAGLALASLGESDGFELLIDIVRSDMDWHQRHSAILALGGLRSGVAVEPLAKLLRDEIVDLRVAAARSLGEIGDPAALPALRAALDDQTRTTEYEDVAVSKIAQQAIERIESRAQELNPCSQ